MDESFSAVIMNGPYSLAHTLGFPDYFESSSHWLNIVSCFLAWKFCCC
jgi:hypothetical protein